MYDIFLNFDLGIKQPMRDNKGVYDIKITENRHCSNHRKYILFRAEKLM
jgi:hypothetical protein